MIADGCHVYIERKGVVGGCLPVLEAWVGAVDDEIDGSSIDIGGVRADYSIFGSFGRIMDIINRIARWACRYDGIWR